MIVTFGDMPPVYAKPKEQVTPYPTQRKIHHHCLNFVPSGFRLICKLFNIDLIAFMPQPTGGGPGYGLPYPASSNAFPPYPTSNFGGFPAYPGASGASNPPSSGYPYPTPNPSHSGYNNFYGGASVSILFMESLFNFLKLQITNNDFHLINSQIHKMEPIL